MTVDRLDKSGHTCIIDKQQLTSQFARLREAFEVEKVTPERKRYLCTLIRKYGYLPYPHQKALDELTAAETLIAVEEKLRICETYDEETFKFAPDMLSPVKRAGYIDSSWIKKEYHNIKIVNLAALGNGCISKTPGHFIDWLKQLVILPSGNLDKGVLATTLYLLPFHPREFGCAYIPKSSRVSSELEDPFLKQTLGMDVNNQLKLFLMLTQLAGHPIIYDVLPHTGRFSTIVLSKPYLARWFDVNLLIEKLSNSMETIAADLSTKYDELQVESTKNSLMDELKGTSTLLCNDHYELMAAFRTLFLENKKTCSYVMTTKEVQESIVNKVKEIISRKLNKNADEEISEEDITRPDELIENLMQEGLWPAPGGAWCSYGVPVFDKLSIHSKIPIFLHFDQYGNDVSKMANLDYSTPYYFVYLDKKEYNVKVEEFWINYLKRLRDDYNFDGYRIDHVDHVVDDFSQQNGFPMSYRIPAKSLMLVKTELKKVVPHFATVAEYMLWDDLLEEYHNEMQFDLLWGNDIIAQYQKTVRRISEDNNRLERYNLSVLSNDKLSILKTYNNQDGEYESINQFPGQLADRGAIFKWLKLKLLPGGCLSSRPTMYVDGDESFTVQGTQKAINTEESMPRNRNNEFYRIFNAIDRLVLTYDVFIDGKTSLHVVNREGLVSWYISSEHSNYAILIVANEKPPKECIMAEDGKTINVENSSIKDIHILVPPNYRCVSELVLTKDALEFSERTAPATASEQGMILFTVLKPSEFHLYKLIENNS